MAKKRTKIYFLRKPLKPVLYMSIFCVLLLASLIFALQYELDKKAIQDIVDNYSYVATLYNNQKDAAALRPLPDDLVKRINESKYTRDVENRTVYSGRTEATDTILDYFVTEETVDLYGMLVGAYYPVDYNQRTGYEQGYLTTRINLAGVMKGQAGVTVNIWHDRKADGSYPDESELYDGMYSNNPFLCLVIGRFEFSREMNGLNYNIININNPHINTAKTKMDRLPIRIPLRLNSSDEDILEYVTELLKQEDLYDEMLKIEACRNLFTVRPITEMSMLMTFADHSSYVNGGRGLTRDDAGKKVCMINSLVARKNNLFVGDHIKLAISDVTYKHNAATHNAEWVCGIPGVDDELPDYGEYEDYEIVGMYNFYVKRNSEEDFFKFSKNDIFIPADPEQVKSVENIENILPCNYTFRILGPDYEKFMDDFEIEIFDKGFVLHSIDAGWEELQSNYDTLMSRKLISMFSATVTLTAAVVLFCILLLKHFRYEFGLRRLLGASSAEASGIYVAGYFVLGIPAILVSLAATLVVYDKWLAGKMASVIENGLPKITEILRLLSVWVGIAFGAGLVLLLISGLINGKKNLLKMIK